jgi:hypothetical protein
VASGPLGRAVLRWGTGRVPPRWVREGLRARGLAPADAGWLAFASPWVGHAALEVDRAWYRAEIDDLALDMGASAPPTPEEWVSALFAVRERLGPDRIALAREMFDAEDPAVRSSAWFAATEFGPVPPELLLDPDLDEQTKLALGAGWCTVSAGLDDGEREVLRRQVRAASDERWAVVGAMVGLRAAFDGGADTSGWLAEVEDARGECLLAHGDGACLSAEEWSSLQAELGHGAPADWQTALRAAVFACHRDADVGPLEGERVAEGRWDESWRFDPVDPFLDCVAARAGHPDPPAGTRIALEVEVRGQPR